MAIDTDSYNLALRNAASLLRVLASRMPREVEVGYNQWVTNPKAAAYRSAAEDISALIEPEQETP